MKLIGKYRAVVTAQEFWTSPKGNNFLKLTLDVTDEHINGELHSMDKGVTTNWLGGLGTKIGKNGKSSAQITAEQLKEAFGYVGGLGNLPDLVLMPVDIVCEDDGSKYTKVAYINNVNRKVTPSGSLTEFSSDVRDELEKIFAAVA